MHFVAAQLGFLVLMACGGYMLLKAVLNGGEMVGAMIDRRYGKGRR